MSDKRREPAAFRLDPPAPPDVQRAPQAFRLDAEGVVASPEDAFALEAEGLVGAAVVPPRKRGWLGTMFATAFGILVSLALGLWTDALVRDLFARAEWLGWFGLGAAVLAAAALLAIVLRELLALRRLASVEHMRARARDAIAANDAKRARAIVDELGSMMASRPEAAAGLRAMAELRGEVMDADSLLGLAETELLGPADRRARIIVLESAKRVSLVTAVSPRAAFDVAYVAWEASRLLRRLAELYGGRPGTLGFFRLLRSALAHLAVTGSIAAGDSVIQQLVGQGLAARLSAKLGEGVVNGMMTARIGVAAMEAARPLPFAALPRPKRPSRPRRDEALTLWGDGRATSKRAPGFP